MAISEKSLKNLRPLPKGVSGNPKGRPKGALSLTTILQAALEADTTVKWGDKQVTIKKKDAIIQALINKAVNERDIQAIREIFDRIDGKAKQTIESKNVNENFNHEELTPDEKRTLQSLLDKQDN